MDGILWDKDITKKKDKDSTIAKYIVKCCYEIWQLTT